MMTAANRDKLLLEMQETMVRIERLGADEHSKDLTKLLDSIDLVRDGNLSSRALGHAAAWHEVLLEQLSEAERAPGDDRPSEMLMDLLLPSEVAEEAAVSLESAYPRWISKYGRHRAGWVFRVQVLRVVISYYAAIVKDWLPTIIQAMR